MRTEQLRNWMRGKLDCGEGITLGGIDANREYCLGICLAAGDGGRRCLGGAENTRCRPFYAEVVVHWGRDAARAEAKARAVWALFDGLTDTVMNGARVVFADPGAITPRQRDGRGICEFVMRLTVWYALPDGR
ncbi:MAG: hypothetical protein PHO10_03065 [Gemmiger sp.]|nr:hypothetical protein [Gemmiger sp.]